MSAKENPSRLRLRDPRYGTGKWNAQGEPAVDWDGCRTQYADKDGFDIREDYGGRYYIETVLPKGTKLLRYGGEQGKYTAPIGTEYEAISLPYVKESVPYHEYEVISDSIRVRCNVRKGKVAPMFDYPGGGIQYYHLDGTIKQLVDGNILKRMV